MNSAAIKNGGDGVTI